MKHIKTISQYPDSTDKKSAPGQHTFTTDEERWQALLQRDPEADGQFVYSVTTTGVYCRPTCPSRRARRGNVKFHDTCAAAERAGYRPCKRCQPTAVSLPQRDGEIVARICRVIESSDQMPELDTLAEIAGLSRYHFHRIFKKIVGVTPRQYAMAHRTQRLRSELRQRPSVIAAIYEAGFNSNSRFYEHSSETLGMTPREYRSGGKGITIQYAIAPCPLGLVMVAGTARGICSVSFGAERSALEQQLRQDFPAATLAPPDPAFTAWVETIVNHLKQPSGIIEHLPLDIRGTAFQQRVWQALRQIPAGHTMSYADVADRIGQPSAARAVARACASNPVAVIIPCHRVLKKDGGLSGYRWGQERKQSLLKQEGAGRDKSKSNSASSMIAETD